MLPPLLRLLLCLCLLVDAVAPAVAGTHLAMAQVDTVGAPAAAAGDAQPAMADCHTLPGADAERVAPAAPAQDDDCLERCLDLCLQHAAASVPTVAALSAPGPAGAPARAAAAQVEAVHAFPILRPPIG